jgi:hypothetical protein
VIDVSYEKSINERELSVGDVARRESMVIDGNVRRGRANRDVEYALAEECELKTNDFDLPLEASQVALIPDHRLPKSLLFLYETLAFIPVQSLS